MKEINLSIEKYTGADIVTSLIKQNSQLYGSNLRQFVQIDLLHDNLPKADAILCRECLVHLSLEDAIQAIENIKSSAAQFLLTTYFPELQHNRDIVSGKHRPLNMRKPSFEWPAAIEEIVEYSIRSKQGTKCLSVWRIADLP